MGVEQFDVRIVENCGSSVDFEIQREIVKEKLPLPGIWKKIAALRRRQARRLKEASRRVGKVEPRKCRREGDLWETYNRNKISEYQYCRKSKFLYEELKSLLEAPELADFEPYKYMGTPEDPLKNIRERLESCKRKGFFHRRRPPYPLFPKCYWAWRGAISARKTFRIIRHTHQRLTVLIFKERFKSKISELGSRIEAVAKSRKPYKEAEVIEEELKPEMKEILPSPKEGREGEVLRSLQDYMRSLEAGGRLSEKWKMQYNFLKNQILPKLESLPSDEARRNFLEENYPQISLPLLRSDVVNQSLRQIRGKLVEKIESGEAKLREGIQEVLKRARIIRIGGQDLPVRKLLESIPQVAANTEIDCKELSHWSELAKEILAKPRPIRAPFEPILADLRTIIENQEAGRCKPVKVS